MPLTWEQAAEKYGHDCSHRAYQRGYQDGYIGERNDVAVFRDVVTDSGAGATFTDRDWYEIGHNTGESDKNQELWHS